MGRIHIYPTTGHDAKDVTLSVKGVKNQAAIKVAASRGLQFQMLGIKIHVDAACQISEGVLKISEVGGIYMRSLEISCASPDTANAGLCYVSSGSGVLLKSVINKTKCAVKALASHLYIDNILGTGNNYGISAESGALLSVHGAQPAGTVANENTAAGGKIFK